MILLIVVVLLVSFSYFQNNAIITSEYSIQSNKLPESFDGYTIVQLSDLHNKSFRADQSYLVNRVNNLRPDLIVFTGDLIDSRKYDEKPSLLLMEKLVKVAPVYYVTGNHEWRSGIFDDLEVKLQNIGVNVMRNSSEEIVYENEIINLIGIDDPAKGEATYAEKTITEENLNKVEIIKGEGFQILLAHRPEFFSLYASAEFDLVFTGHAHGGQFRLPFIGGLVAPNQGFFPSYTSGIYKENNKTTMIVNRGLGNSIIPQRVFNRPEIVVVKLHAEK
ncbi:MULTISPECIES: metallophosphoesterase [Bacillaceae]|uniref:Metallophosphoesterase n=1 Tax=Evansella alkalicola TaxID=745819 RepID=A0ABS6JZK7_9BACI|nr:MULTISPECIES: metallophosphoesterase [Bacillaceae]MBU9722652.1 metallophosphoesterase [Bacillus alkalicola]